MKDKNGIFVHYHNSSLFKSRTIYDIIQLHFRHLKKKKKPRALTKEGKCCITLASPQVLFALPFFFFLRKDLANFARVGLELEIFLPLF
jgi:hypothetical protein